MAAPFYYDYLDLRNSAVVPSVVHSKNTTLTRYYQRYLIQKVMATMKIDGMPEDWDPDYFMYVLLINGIIAIVDTQKFGVIPQQCTLNGRNVFYQPSHVVISNPLLPIIDRKIGEGAALIKMQPDYCGCWDIISYYADMMSLTSESIAMNIENSKLAMVFGVDNQQSAESFKKMFDKLQSGEPAVFVDKRLLGPDGEPMWQTFIQNLSQNYIGSTLMADLKKWETEFESEIGIPNSNYEKQSHLLEDEIHSNDISTRSKLDLWIETIQRGLDDANSQFGLNLQINPRYEDDMLGGEDDEGDAVDSWSNEAQS